MVFVIMHIYCDEVKELVGAMKEYDAKNGTFTYAREFNAMTTATPDASTSSTTTTTTGRCERRPSMIAKASDLMWMSSKVDKFDAPCWWTSSYLIVMRILQTSAMALIATPSLQAAVMSLIALVGVSVQTHAAPYRRASDNHAALVAAWLLFACSCCCCAIRARWAASTASRSASR